MFSLMPWPHVFLFIYSDRKEVENVTKKMITHKRKHSCPEKKHKEKKWKKVSKKNTKNE